MKLAITLIGAAICCLFFSRGPAHVSGLVVAVIVDTVNRVRRGWFGTKLLKEFFKRSEAELNAASAVIVIPAPVDIAASALCRVEGAVLRAALVGAMTVRGLESPLEAAAATARSANDAAGSHDANVPAVALGDPVNVSVCVANSSDRPKKHPSRVSLSRKFHWFGHGAPVLTPRLYLVIAAFAMLIGSAHSQNVRYDIGVPGSAGVTTTQGIGTPFLVAVPSVQLQWCTYPANANPCSNFASTFTALSGGTACPTNAQIVLQGTSSCVSTSDVLGNMGVYVPAGTYSYTLSVGGAAISPVPFTVTVGGSGGGSGGGSSGQIVIDTANSGGLTGSNVGAWINSAITAASPGTTITLACGTFTPFTTQVDTTAGKNVVITGCGIDNTILLWTGSGPAFKVGGAGGGYQTFSDFTIQGPDVSSAGQYGFYVHNANNMLNILRTGVKGMGDLAGYIDGATANVTIANNSWHGNHFFRGAVEVNSTSAQNVILTANSFTGNNGGIYLPLTLGGVSMSWNDVECLAFASAFPMLDVPNGVTGNSSFHNTFGCSSAGTMTDIVLINGNHSLHSSSDSSSIGKAGQVAWHLGNTAQAIHVEDLSVAGILTGVGTGIQIDSGALDNYFEFPQFFNTLGSNITDAGTRTTCISNLLFCAKGNLLGAWSFSGQISAPSAFFSGAGAGAITCVQGVTSPIQPYASWQLLCGTVAPGANLIWPAALQAGVLVTTAETGAAGTVACAACGTLTGTGTISSGGFYTVAPGCAITGGGGSGAACTSTLAVTPGPVTGITITNGGTLYTSVATINFTDQAVTKFANTNYRYTDTESSATENGRLVLCLTALASTGGTCDMSREPAGSFTSTVSFTQSGITIILPPNTITFPNNVTINKSGNNSNVICKTQGACILDASNNGSVGAINVTAGSVGLIQNIRAKGGRLNSQTGFEFNISGSYQVIDGVSVDDAGAFGIQLVNCYECKATNSPHVDRSTKAGIGVNTSLLTTTDPTTQSGTTATITASAANQILGPTGTISPVYVTGCANGTYNGDFTGTVTGAKTFTYTMPSAPGANTTGCSYTIRSIGVLIAWNNLNDVNTTDTGDGGIAVQSSGGVGLTDGTKVMENNLRYKVFGTTSCSNPTNTAPSIIDTGCSEAIQQTDKPTNTEIAGNYVINSYRESYASSGTGLRMHHNMCINPALVSVGTGNGCYMLSVSSGGGLSVAGDAVIDHNIGFNSGTNTSAYCLSIQAGGGSSATTFRNIEVANNACEGLLATFGIGVRWNNAAANTMTLQNLNFHDNAFTNVTTNESYSTTNTTGAPRSINNTPSAPTCTFTSGGGTSPSCTVDTGSTDYSGIIVASTGTGAPAGTGTITLTFSIVRGANKPACTFMASDNVGGAWAALPVMKDLTPSTASDIFTWTNGVTPTALSTSTAYRVNYSCNQK